MDNYIFEIEDFVPPELCRAIIEKFEGDDRKSAGKMQRGIDISVKKSTDLHSSEYKNWRSIGDSIAVKVAEGMKKYLDHLDSTGVNKNKVVSHLLHESKIGFPNIQRTDEGGFYKWHFDEAYGSRLLTYIVYLNDVEEGCGGTTDFSYGKSILPKEGKLLLFPATWNYIHTGKKLEKGVKYIATGFVYRTRKCQL